MERVRIDMNFSNQAINDQATLIKVEGARLDAASSVDFKNYFNDTVSDRKSNVIIDLSEVNFMDSSGLGVLISSLKSMEKDGGISLVGAHSNVQSLMTLTRMDRLFPQFSSVDEAVTAAQS